MTRRTLVGGGFVTLAARGQDTPFVCPMDPDVRSATAAKCPRCGMKLVPGIPEHKEFTVDLRMEPRVPLPGKPVLMRFTLRDPSNGKQARLQLIHEKLLHLFLVNGDLSYFAHEHPELQSDGSFLFEATLPGGGEYRVFCDFYPENATPQMIARTIYARGAAQATAAVPELGLQKTANLAVSLRTEPMVPLAGTKTMLFFRLDPDEGLEPYLGAWGHMLCTSADLIDVVHTHPAWEDRSDTIQFNLIFPRAGLHRVWVQFQRRGILNTARFTIPVQSI
ncbi:MAG: hypothetical protein H7039_05730 [Bryobacteraceae bacterium]|nr:hypothetical protein [Bryobacteraceae bacterium]